MIPSRFLLFLLQLYIIFSYIYSWAANFSWQPVGKFQIILLLLIVMVVLYCCNPNGVSFNGLTHSLHRDLILYGVYFCLVVTWVWHFSRRQSTNQLTYKTRFINFVPAELSTLLYIYLWSRKYISISFSFNRSYSINFILIVCHFLKSLVKLKWVRIVRLLPLN